MKNVAVVFPDYGVGIISQDYNKAIECLSNFHFNGLESILKTLKENMISYHLYDSKIVYASVNHSPHLYTYIHIEHGIVAVRDGSKHSCKRGVALALNEVFGMPFKAEKLYRFSYSGGTRAGQKRAVKVLEVHPTFIRAEDLDTGEARSYTLSKVSDISELKL